MELFVRNEVVDETVRRANTGEADRARLSHMELTDGFCDDSYLRFRLLAFDVGDDDEEKVGRGHRATNLRLLEADNVRLGTGIDLELEEAIELIHRIGPDAVLRAEISHLVS